MLHRYIQNRPRQLPTRRLQLCSAGTHSYPSLPPSCLQRRSWHQYSKRLAKAAVGASRWVRRLQEYTLHPLDAMSTHAGQSLEVRWAASGCERGCVGVREGKVCGVVGVEERGSLGVWGMQVDGWVCMMGWWAGGASSPCLPAASCQGGRLSPGSSLLMHPLTKVPLAASLLCFAALCCACSWQRLPATSRKRYRMSTLPGERGA